MTHAINGLVFQFLSACRYTYKSPVDDQSDYLSKEVLTLATKRASTRRRYVAQYSKLPGGAVIQGTVQFGRTRARTRRVVDFVVGRVVHYEHVSILLLFNKAHNYQTTTTTSLQNNNF